MVACDPADADGIHVQIEPACMQSQTCRQCPSSASLVLLTGTAIHDTSMRTRSYFGVEPRGSKYLT